MLNTFIFSLDCSHSERCSSPISCHTSVKVISHYYEIKSDFGAYGPSLFPFLESVYCLCGLAGKWWNVINKIWERRDYWFFFQDKK